MALNLGAFTVPSLFWRIFMPERNATAHRKNSQSYELLSKLLVSPLIAPTVVPYIIPYITPFKEFRLWLIYKSTSTTRG